MNNLERYFEIDITELDANNLFFSVVKKCKEKNILENSELLYVDSELNRMIEESAKLCGKGYIKQESAKTMLKNIFMILDSVYPVSDFREIINCIKERKLWEMWRRGVSESIAYFDRTQKNIFHLEHFFYKYPHLKADFAINLKNDYAFSNIYTHSFENAKFTKAFFSISENESFREVCERSEILCAECAFLEKMAYSDLLPILNERGGFRADGGVKYTALLIDAIIISMCYGAFYRCEGFYPSKEYARKILSEIVNENIGDLEENLLSYLNIVVGRYNLRKVEKQASYGENILNVYESRLCEENIKALAVHLAKVISQKRTTEKGLMNLIHFE